MTLIVCIVSPDDHRLPVASEEVNVTEPPSQNVVGPPAVTTSVVGVGFTVTVIGTDVAEHPFPSVYVTV